MENWIGAYRLPPNLGLGVERNTDSVDGVGGGGGGGGGDGAGAAILVPISLSVFFVFFP